MRRKKLYFLLLVSIAALLAFAFASAVTIRDVIVRHQLSSSGVSYRPPPPPPFGTVDDITTVWFGTEATDAEIIAATEVLSKLRGLHSVRLNYSKVKGPGICRIVDLPNLRQLSLEGAKIDDTDLKCICSNKNLQWLNLTDTATSDQGIACLPSVPHLDTVYLNGTNVTAEGIIRLASLKELRAVVISKAKISEDEILAIRKAMPHVTLLEN